MTILLDVKSFRLQPHDFLLEDNVTDWKSIQGLSTAVVWRII
jgi:hypothetical protein